MDRQDNVLNAILGVRAPGYKPSYLFHYKVNSLYRDRQYNKSSTYNGNEPIVGFKQRTYPICSEIKIIVQKTPIN